MEESRQNMSVSSGVQLEQMRISPRKYKREEGMPRKLESEKPWCWIHQTSKGFGEFL